MKKNLLNWMTILMVAIASVGFSSCGGDDDGDKSGGSIDNSIVQNLISYKWYRSSTDYDVYSYGGATYTQTWNFYFINDHQGILYWTAVDRDSSLGTSRDEEYCEFEYFIYGNTISIYADRRYELEYHENYLLEADDIYEARILTSDDQQILKKYQDKQKQAEMQPIVEEHVKVKAYRGIARLKVQIESTLKNVYPNSNIKYGIEFGKKYKNYDVQYEFIYWFEDQNDLVLDNVYALDAEGNLYYASYCALLDKINNGETLSSEEEELYRGLVDFLENEYNESNYKWRVVVDIDGIRCYQEYYEEYPLYE